jgi:serine phosphatase RsbU (regulator of sigma subunit)
MSFLLFACNLQKPEIQYVKKGVIDLRSSSLENISLKGEFAFAWQKAVSPAEMKGVKQYINLPDEWNKYGYPPQGYATYSFTILLPSKRPKLALTLPNVATAYRLWFNDMEVYQLGNFASQADSSVAKYQKAIIPVNSHLLRGDTLQITLQISNYEHFRGGIYNPIYFGNLNASHKNTVFTRDFEVFALGALFFMLVFHLILFAFLSQKKNYESLFLAVLCALVVIRTMIISVGSQYWLVLFPESSFELLLRIEFLATYATPLFMVLFVNALIPNILSKKFLLFTKIIGISISVLALLPIKSYLYSLPLFYLVMLTAYLTEIYVSVKGFAKGYKEAPLILTAFLLPFVFSVLEVLHHQGIFHLAYANVASIGMMGFLFIQSFVISYRIAKTFEKVAYLSKNLEQEVTRRTQELEMQNAELEHAKEQIEKARENTMASIRYAQRIQNAVLPSHRTLSKHLKEYFIFYQPRDVVSGDFYWFQGKEDEFYIAVADCTGHGVPGAIMAVMADISLDYAFFRQDYQDLSEMLAAFDRELIKLLNKNVNPEEEPAQDGLVIALCKVDKKTKLLTYTAASSPAFIIREGVLIELNPDKHIIGGSIKEGKEFGSQTFQLEENDMLYLFSDGYQDQFGGEKKKKMGTRRLKELLLEITQKPTQEQKEMVEQEFNLWKGNHSQIDDVLVMGIRF